MAPQKLLVNLASREVYDLDETGHLNRWIMGVLAGLFCGVAFGLFFPWAFVGLMSLLVSTPLPGFSAFQSVAIGIAFGVPFGLVMAWLSPKKMRQGMCSFYDSLYAGDPQLVPPPPQSENEFTSRLPCSWMKSANFAIGGVLYLGQGCMTFVPHTKNLSKDREPFEIPQLDTATVSTVEPSLNFFARLLISKPPMEIKWAGGSARFIVPEAEETLVKVLKVTGID
ncbi:MAG: hypothetical protein ABJC10_13145 [Acidobacteriota bacterium]